MTEDEMLKYERALYKDGIEYIAGIDEVGRGPLVGPVVTACVVLPKNFFHESIKDSKKLSEKKREEMFKVIEENALAIGIGIRDNKRIDEINILEATKEAMKEAYQNAKKKIKIEHVLIDAVKLDLDVPSTSIIKGDANSESIAAASIIAKVTRDHMLDELDEVYPEYGFKKNKGYGTKAHIEALYKYGKTPLHRNSFKPCGDIEKINIK